MKSIKTFLKTLSRIWGIKNKHTDDFKMLMVDKLRKDNSLTEEKEDYREAFLDNATVFLFIPKKTELRKIIEETFIIYQKRVAKQILSSMNFKLDNFGEISSLYSSEYLNIIFNLTKGYDSVKLKFKKDSPLFVETEDFIIILAPRVEEKEEN